jgi:protoporphyrinogen oxidase
LHDQDPDITKELQGLLDGRLRKVSLPSYVYSEGELFHFPLLFLELLEKKGVRFMAKACLELLAARTMRNRPTENFEDFAVARYGRTIAERFLLNYSEKLWGIPCAELSASVSGRRLKGLDLKTFLSSLISRDPGGTAHLEGEFYYPEGGIGRIGERLAEVCGWQNIRLNSRVTQIFLDHKGVSSIEIDHKKLLAVDEVVSTLPIPVLLELLEPRAPEELMRASSKLRFRNLRLVALFISKARVLNCATLYFPDKSLIFTRIYEPKNRSSSLAPQHMTSLVAEIPCFEESELWTMGENELSQRVCHDLVMRNLVKEEDIVGTRFEKLRYAYPVLERSHGRAVESIKSYLKGCRNLRITGRNGTFTYSWIHDMFRWGKDLVANYGANWTQTG